MAQKFPDTLPPKGKGRVDNKHQIALLTDFEVQALNHLKNKDKERGFPSGSGPEIQALAAQNSRPFEFVNYRGEQIPSLNDYAGAGIGSGSGERNESAGESEARNQTSSGGDKTWWELYGGGVTPGQPNPAGRQPDPTPPPPPPKKSWWEEMKEGLRTEDGSWNPMDSALLGGKDTGYNNPGIVNDLLSYFGYDEYGNKLPGESDGPAGGPIPGVENPEEIAKFKNDIKDGKDTGLPDEVVEMFQEEIDNDALIASGKEAKIGGAAGFDQDLSGTYRGAYEQQLSDAYDAAKTGVGYDILGAGGLPEFDDAGNPIDQYARLEGAAEGQGTYLDTLASNYQGQAQSQYDDWLSTNTTAINDLTSLEDINSYEWSAMPEYDTDWSGGLDADGNFDADWMPEFYEGFTKEYGKDYLGSDSWQYDADGNPMPGTYTPSTTDTSTTEGEEGATKSAPALTSAPGLKPGKRGAAGVAQFGRSAARYI